MKHRLFFIEILLLLIVPKVSAQQVIIKEVVIDPGISQEILELVLPERLTKDTDEELRIHVNDLHELEQEIVDNLVKQGYPYTQVKLDSILVTDQILESRLNINSGVRVKVDSLVVQPQEVFNTKLLPPLTGIKKGDWFSQMKLDEANQRLQYYGLTEKGRALEAGFFDSLAWIYIYPVKPKSNRFDGIIGLQPGSIEDVPRLTGSLNLRLSNLLGWMEEVNLKWKSTGNQSQKLNALLSLPYIFSSGLGISAGLNLYKRDSAYLLLDTKIAGRYTFSPGIYAEAYYGFRQSRQILVQDLNEQGDFDLNISGLSWSLDQIGLTEEKKRGWRITQTIGVGSKNYESRELSGSEFYWETELATRYNLPAFQHGMIVAELAGGFRSGLLQENEQFRLGGAQSIRGFQEENFYTGLFTQATLEYRYYFGYQSDFHGFIDGGWLKGYGYVYAPGVGLNLDTRAGILSLDYALGQIAENGFSFKSGLIHLGIQSNF